MCVVWPLQPPSIQYIWTLPHHYQEAVILLFPSRVSVLFGASWLLQVQLKHLGLLACSTRRQARNLVEDGKKTVREFELDVLVARGARHDPTLQHELVLRVEGDVALLPKLDHVAQLLNSLCPGEDGDGPCLHGVAAPAALRP